VTATGEFTAAAPDPKLPANTQLAQYAFQLKQEEPVSDAIQGPEGFYVVHLLGMTPSRPLTLDEAKPKITETLNKERLKQLVSTRAADVSRTIREAIRAGTPLDRALAQLGLQAERVPVFSIIETPPAPIPEQSPSPKPEEKKPDVPDLPSIKNAVRELNPGDASDFVSTQTGGLVVVLESREPGDPAGFAQVKATFEKNYLQSKKMVVFDEWLHDRRRAAGLQTAVAPPAET
jgi:parvulin-like peptidyl-prolyl isomerase